MDKNYFVKIEVCSVICLGEYLVTGGAKRLVIVRSVHQLAVVRQIDGSCDHGFGRRLSPFPSPIYSLVLSRHERHLLVGLQTGEICVLALDAGYLRERLQRKLANLGF